MATKSELEGFRDALAEAYDDMEASVGTVRSPFFGTLMDDNDERFDALIFDRAPTAGAGSERPGVVFLHGFGGNWSVLCWLVAEAVDEAMTICPSADLTGRWERFGARVRVAIAELRRRGVSRVYLAGLSQGAVGASRLMEQLEDQQLAGLMLLFGFTRHPPPTRLPTLLLAADNDVRFRLASAEKRYELDHVDLVVVAGDHFALVKRREPVATAISKWFKRQL